MHRGTALKPLEDVRGFFSQRIILRYLKAITQHAQHCSTEDRAILHACAVAAGIRILPPHLIRTRQMRLLFALLVAAEVISKGLHLRKIKAAPNHAPSLRDIWHGILRVTEASGPNKDDDTVFHQGACIDGRLKDKRLASYCANALISASAMAAMPLSPGWLATPACLNSRSARP